MEKELGDVLDRENDNTLYGIVERLRRVPRLEGNRIDKTHPPTPLRIAFIELHPAAPVVRIDRTEEKALDAEFNALVPKIQTKLIDEYREYLYEL